MAKKKEDAAPASEEPKPADATGAAAPKAETPKPEAPKPDGPAPAIGAKPADEASAGGGKKKVRKH